MSKSRVIIVGGGPVGLMAAHCLSKAEIDFVVLEGRPSIVEDVGASLVINPQSLRVMAQLGLLQKFRMIGQEMLHMSDYTMQGRKYKQGWHTMIVKENVGQFPMVFHRAEVVQLLYENLSETDRSKVFTGKKVVSLESREGEAQVVCADGTVHEGSMIIGADGVHSITRQLMDGSADPKSHSETRNGQTPFPIEYRTLWASFPRVWEHAPGDMMITHGNQVSVQCLNGRNRTWIFVYERLGKPVPMERVRYTEKDIEAFVEKHADAPVGEHFRLKDLFGKRHACGMSNLEEGVLPSWSSGRVVLAGDACHKYAPIAGLGFNSGVQDIVTITNELRQSLQAIGPNAPISQSMLSEVFKKYQSWRKPLAHKEVGVSATMTKLSAWPNTMFWFIDQYIVSTIPSFEALFFNYVICRRVVNNRALDFIGGGEPFQGKLPWVHPIPKDPVEGKAWSLDG